MSDQNKLYVGGLPYATTNDELKAHFEAAGPVVEAVVITDRETGRSRGFGFVTMETAEGAEAAISQFDGSDLGGRTLKVNPAQSRD